MNLKLKILVLVALVFGAYCCSPKGDGSVSEVIVNGDKMYVFSLDDLKSDTATVLLSSLVDNCILVQLETTEEAYFRYGSTTVTEKYIGIRSERAPYKLFDHSGRFLRNIGAIGNGPGEWTISLYDDIIDDKNELIYLSSFVSNKILVYSTSGQFVKEIVTPARLQKPKIFLSDNILTVVHMPFQNDKAVAYQFDVKTGELLSELAPPACFIVQSFDGELFTRRNVPGVFDFVHTSSDTLYNFDVKNNKILPVFRAISGTPEKFWLSYSSLNKEIFLTNVSVLSEEQQRYMGVGTVATDFKTKTSSWVKAVNDFYGGMPISIGSVGNGYWVRNIHPERLMEEIENRLAQKGLSENDRQILNKTLSTLKENTNNVVFIGKLKDEIETKLW